MHPSNCCTGMGGHLLESQFQKSCVREGTGFQDEEGEGAVAAVAATGVDAAGAASPARGVSRGFPAEKSVLYSMMGSPMLDISGMLHFRSNVFARTTLKIFVTFTAAWVEENIKGAFMARANLRAWFVISSCSSGVKVTNWSYLVPIKNARAFRLSARTWRYHSLTLLSVDLRERSNMKSIADASLQTRGSMLRKSRWPPRSQMLKVISVPLTTTDFSIKLTPRV
mmetsp:Transcript_1819/g.4138  ORF Transcript_1819/g.4138 Transcript_1819/m.4138 type:complete len:225 (-) Transcript_1819:266-940(-)